MPRPHRTQGSAIAAQTIVGWLPRRAALMGAAHVFVTASCGPVGTRSAASAGAPRLFAVSAAEGSLATIDVARGTVVGRAIPLGLIPEQIALTEDGTLVAVSMLSAGEPPLAVATLRVSDGGATGPGGRRVALQGLAQPALLATDGRLAGVACRSAGLPYSAGADRLVLFDPATARVVADHAVAAAGEQITGLALDASVTPPRAYLSLARRGAGRVVALDAAGAAVLRTRTVSGEPGGLGLAPAESRGGRRLYALVAAPPADPDTSREAGSLLGFDADTFALDQEAPFDPLPGRMVPGPEGATLYLLADTTVLQLDMTTGIGRRFVSLPRRGIAMAADAARLYVAFGRGRDIQVYWRRNGRPAPPLRAGRNVVALAAGTAFR